MATHQKKHVKKRISSNINIYKTDDMEDYAKVIKAVNSDATFEVELIKNNTKIIAGARGSMIKGPNKQKINPGDTILIQKDTSTTKEKYFICYKFSPEDVKRLTKMGELSKMVESVTKDENIVFEGDVILTNKNIKINDDFINNII